MTTKTTLLTAIFTSTLLLTACGDKAQTQNQAKTDTKATAQTTSSGDTAVIQALQANLDKSGVTIKVTNAIATQMPDIYWVSFDNAPAMFTDKSGTYLIQGQIAKLGDGEPVDIGADLLSAIAKDALAKVPESEQIIYPAKGDKKAHIYVFTDPTCHYCQKLHSEIDAITTGGVEVRYLAWPRAQKDVPLAKAIWCSSNRQDALAQAKQGKAINAPDCDNPVEQHMALGHTLGVSGTPAIFTASGMQIGGYVPADELIKLAIDNQ
ncbi:DsbC family protein [Moraxella pluranimalium]|uniref:Thiol:disulfide interchange protein n=1 Tax=Moraxella pluranimalium TaxID=470453 RepID=A0A1T0CTH5_9GAMM|nr:DsbC family protein [Moraxella pluranimalium]OOS25655.1 thiol:disulfide interchange protein [Moraxella pluranimalium]